MKKGTKVIINAFKPRYFAKPLVNEPGVIVSVLKDPGIKKLGTMFRDPYIVEVQGKKVRFFEHELTAAPTKEKKKA